MIRCMEDVSTLACDIPSGLNGNTGRAYDPCVQADITLTFQLPKHGHFLQDGLDACGEVITADVGFPEHIFPDARAALLQPCDLRHYFPPRRRNIHKGSCGHLLIIAGSVGMAGAAALCAKAALRSGTGLVSIACPEEILPILQIHAPCAMCIPLPQEGGAISAEALPVLQEAFTGKSAIAIGPGLSKRVPPQIIRAVLECELPAVIDADALNIIAESPDLMALLKPHHVITPHPGEAARLLHYDFYWLSREIKRLTGKTYTELVQDKRLAQACFLLRTTNRNVDEIARAVGYENMGYFHRIFRGAFGVSPREYRLQIR